MRDGRPVQPSDFRQGDRLTATIVTSRPPRVVTEKEVRAMVPTAPPAEAPSGRDVRHGSSAGAPRPRRRSRRRPEGCRRPRARGRFSRSRACCRSRRASRSPPSGAGTPASQASDAPWAALVPPMTGAALHDTTPRGRVHALQTSDRVGSDGLVRGDSRHWCDVRIAAARVHQRLRRGPSGRDLVVHRPRGPGPSSFTWSRSWRGPSFSRRNTCNARPSVGPVLQRGDLHDDRIRRPRVAAKSGAWWGRRGAHRHPDVRLVHRLLLRRSPAACSRHTQTRWIADHGRTAFGDSPQSAALAAGLRACRVRGAVRSPTTRTRCCSCCPCSRSCRSRRC